MLKFLKMSRGISSDYQQSYWMWQFYQKICRKKISGLWSWWYVQVIYVPWNAFVSK